MATIPTTITRDDWLSALAEAGIGASGEDDQQAITVSEFASMMELPLGTSRDHLLALIRQGKAVATRKTTVNAYGRRLSYKAYRLV